MAPLLRVEQLSRGFGDGARRIRILEQLDLQLLAGQRLTIVGPSGSGKSTLLNLLAGLDRPDSGRVCWHLDGRDRDLSTLDEAGCTRFRRRHLGFVFQFFNLVPTLTALENVALMAELNRLPDARERAARQLAALGLSARADAFPETLSGGEQQRVAIARALVHEPAAILADEPTGNLDRATADQVFAQLLQAVAEHDTALVVVTHDPERVAGSDLTLDLARAAP